MNNNELRHFGVLGMKWGRRTTSNKMSRSSSSNKRKIKSKEIKSMSDDELKRTIARLQMEQQYAKLSDAKVGIGKKYTQKLFKSGTAIAVGTTTALTIHDNVGKLLNIYKKIGGK